jgi:protease II
MGFLEELVEWGRMLQEIHAKVVSESKRQPVKGKPWSQTSQFDWVLLSPMQRRRIRDALEEAKTVSNVTCAEHATCDLCQNSLSQLRNRIKLAEDDLGREVYTGNVCGVGGNPTGYPLEDVPEEDWPNFDPMVLRQKELSNLKPMEERL